MVFGLVMHTSGPILLGHGAPNRPLSPGVKWVGLLLTSSSMRREKLED